MDSEKGGNVEGKLSTAASILPVHPSSIQAAVFNFNQAPPNTKE